MLAMENLLANPDVDSPMDAEVATMLKRDKPKFERTAREWTKEYATPKATKTDETSSSGS